MIRQKAKVPVTDSIIISDRYGNRWYSNYIDGTLRAVQYSTVCNYTVSMQLYW